MSLGITSIGSCKSTSIGITTSPVECSKPANKAGSLPKLREKCRDITDLSFLDKEFSIDSVASLEPSLIKTISRSKSLK